MNALKLLLFGLGLLVLVFGEISPEEEEKANEAPVESLEEFRKQILTKHTPQEEIDSADGAIDAPSLELETKGEEVEETSLLPEESRFNYASLDAGAIVLSANSDMRGASNLLVEDRDRYAMTPSTVENQWFVVGLSEEIFVDSIVLGSYERYSSQVDEFEVFGSEQYPAKSWVFLGKFNHHEEIGAQTFTIPKSKRQLVRYLKFKILSYHGAEFYLTISLLRVYGTPAFQALQEEMDASSELTDKIKKGEEEDATSLPVEGPKAEVVAEPPAAGERSAENSSVSPPAAAKVAESENKTAAAETALPVGLAEVPLPALAVPVFPKNISFSGSFDLHSSGWSNILNSSIEGGPTHFDIHPTLLRPPFSNSRRSQAAVTALPWIHRDANHLPLVLQSPRFLLTAGLKVFIKVVGGVGSSDKDSPTPTTIPLGFLGFAARRCDNGEYVALARRKQPGHIPQKLELINTWNRNESAECFVFELIDASHGTWGWIGLLSVKFAEQPPDAPPPEEIQPLEPTSTTSTTPIKEDDAVEPSEIQVSLVPGDAEKQVAETPPDNATCAAPPQIVEEEEPAVAAPVDQPLELEADNAPLVVPVETEELSKGVPISTRGKGTSVMNLLSKRVTEAELELAVIQRYIDKTIKNQISVVNGMKKQLTALNETVAVHNSTHERMARQIETLESELLFLQSSFVVLFVFCSLVVGLCCVNRVCFRRL